MRKSTVTTSRLPGILVLGVVAGMTTLLLESCGGGAVAASPAGEAQSGVPTSAATAVVTSTTGPVKTANPDDLVAASTRFANDLVAQNIAGLALVFTPAGMGKAVAMQAQTQAAMPPGTTFDVRQGQPQAGVYPVDIVLTNAAGESTIRTQWRDINGTWKVDDIGLLVP